MAVPLPGMSKRQGGIEPAETAGLAAADAAEHGANS